MDGTSSLPPWLREASKGRGRRRRAAFPRLFRQFYLFIKARAHFRGGERSRNILTSQLILGGGYERFVALPHCRPPPSRLRAFTADGFGHGAALSMGEDEGRLHWHLLLHLAPGLRPLTYLFLSRWRFDHRCLRPNSMAPPLPAPALAPQHSKSRYHRNMLSESDGSSGANFKHDEQFQKVELESLNIARACSLLQHGHYIMLLIKFPAFPYAAARSGGTILKFKSQYCFA